MRIIMYEELERNEEQTLVVFEKALYPEFARED
jgi:hypothetical protein